MKRDISVLNDEITKVLSKPLNDKSIFKKVKELMKENHGISRGRTMGMLSGQLRIYNVQIAEVYLLCKYLYQTIHEENINPDNFFTAEEIKLYDLYKIDYPSAEKEMVAVFRNVDQVSKNQWICTKETYEDITQKFESNMITYNPRTQRSLVFNNKILVPDIRESVVRQITKSMLEEQFTPNMITLNIRKTDNEDYKYDEKSRTLRVYIDNEQTFLDIVDGMHRAKSFMNVYHTNPKIELFTFINILNFDEPMARKFISQEAMHTPISKGQRKAFDSTDAFVEMAKNINKFGSKLLNELYQKIYDNYNEMIFHNGYTTIALFATAIENNFIIESTSDVTKVEKFLVLFFNQVFGMLREKYNTQNAENLDLFSHNLIVGIVAWAGQLINDSDWQTKLSKLVDQLDLTDNNNGLKEIGISFVDRNGTQTKTIVKKLSIYFKEMIVS